MAERQQVFVFWPIGIAHIGDVVDVKVAKFATQFGRAAKVRVAGTLWKSTSPDRERVRFEVCE